MNLTDLTDDELVSLIHDLTCEKRYRSALNTRYVAYPPTLTGERMPPDVLTTADYAPCVKCGVWRKMRRGVIHDPKTLCKRCASRVQITCESCGRQVTVGKRRGYTRCLPCREGKQRQCESENCAQRFRCLDPLERACAWHRERRGVCRVCSVLFYNEHHSASRELCPKHRANGYRLLLSQAAIAAHGTADVPTREQKQALRRQRCVYCGVEPTAANPMHVDHIRPVSRGGWEVWQNLVPACQSCNQYKGNKTLLEWERERPDLVFHARMVSDCIWTAYNVELLGGSAYGLNMPPIESEWMMTEPRKWSRWAFGITEPRRVNPRAVFRATGGLPSIRTGRTEPFPDECYSS